MKGVIIAALGAIAVLRPALAQDNRTIAERVVARVEAAYFDSTASPEIARALRQHAARGDYDALVGQALADTITAHLRSVRNDGHLAVWYSSDPLPPAREPGQPRTAEELADYRTRARQVNYGFEEVRRLDGNVGYLNLRRVFEADEESGRVAAAAMGLLANADAVILDLRQNGGGGPGMIELLATYFFPDRVHLQDLAWRETIDGRHNVTDQIWTLSYVPGPRLTTQPLYVLTSSGTFSAAEALAFALQTRGRAVVVGEPSGGGAHPNMAVPISDHYVVSVPIGQTIGAVDGTSWEGVGVRPDVPVSAEDALRTAHALALRRLLETAADPDHRELLDEALAALGDAR